MKNETTEIDGVTYRVTQLGAKQGRRVMLHLSKSLAAAMAGGPDALENAVASIEPDVFDEICDLFAVQTKIVTPITTAKGPNQIDQPLAFDSHFAGRYGAMVQWLAFCLKLNFADFFDAAANTVGALFAAPKVESPSEPQPESIGSSGAS